MKLYCPKHLYLYYSSPVLRSSVFALTKGSPLRQHWRLRVSTWGRGLGPLLPGLTQRGVPRYVTSDPFERAMSCFAFQKRHQRFSCAVRKGIKDQFIFLLLQSSPESCENKGKNMESLGKREAEAASLQKDRRSLMLRRSFPFGSSLIASCEECACHGLLWRLYAGNCLVPSCPVLVFSFLFRCH